MTGSEMLAKWNSLTPAERDAWVAEKVMDLQVGWLRYWGMAGRDGLQWYCDDLHRGEWSLDPWPDTPVLGPDEMLAHFGAPHFERRVRWQSRGYREPGEDARCHSLPPFTQDLNAAISVAEKLGLTLLPVRDLADEDNPKLLGWIATDHPVAMGDWADGLREVLLAIEKFLPADLVQPTPAAAICLAGLVYIEGGGEEVNEDG